MKDKTQQDKIITLPRTTLNGLAVQAAKKGVSTKLFIEVELIKLEAALSKLADKILNTKPVK